MGRHREAQLRAALVLSACLVAPACNQNPRDAGPNPYRPEYRALHARKRPTDSALTTNVVQTQPSTTRPVMFSRTTVGPSVLFVNQEPVTIDDVLTPALREKLEQYARIYPAAQYNVELVRAIRTELEQIKSLIVVYQEAKKTLTPEIEERYAKAADEEIQRIVNLEYGGRQAKYERFLARHNRTIERVREETKRRLIVLSYLKERFRPLAEHPKRDELKRYYDAHIDAFTTEARAKMALIQLRFDAMLEGRRSTATSDQLAQAKEQARVRMAHALQELESGVPFASVARAYSDGIKRDAGGVWDEIGPNSLRRWYKPVVEKLFTMSPGETSGVIEGSGAFFIVRCLAITPEQRMSFEEAQPQIADRILDERYAEMQERYVRTLLSKAVIEGEPQFLRAVAAAAPSPHAEPQARR